MPVCRGGASAPQPVFFVRSKVGARVRHNKFLRAILPAFTVPTENSDLFSH